MKIVFVLTQSLDSPSGLGRYGPLARALVGMGHTIEILALHYAWGRLAVRAYDEAGVHVVYAGQMHVSKIGPRKQYFSSGRLLTVALLSTWRMATALARSRMDVIHLGKPQPINVLAARLARRGRAIYCDCDDFEAMANRFGDEWQRWIVRHFEDDVVRYVAGLTVNTRFLLDRYQGLARRPLPIVYVPNGFDPARFSQPVDVARLRSELGLATDDPVVVYVGTLSIQSHAVDLLLEAFVQVARRLPRVRLVLVGGGADYDALVALASRLGLAERVCFVGRVPSEVVAGFFALGDVSVDPVRDDLIARARSPLKVVESLAVGTPVVTGDVGDRRLVLRDGQAGILVRPGVATALADGLLAVLEDSNTAAILRRSAQETRDAFRWDRLARDFVQVYTV